MARITVAEAQAWVEGTKFTVVDPLAPADAEQLVQIEEEVVARVGSTYDITGWTSSANTPRLVKVAIAKLFVAWLYRKTYSESISDTDAAYAALLESNAELLISGMAEGSIEIPGISTGFTGGPLFYPTDASSIMEPTADDTSLGPSKFSMGTVF